MILHLINMFTEAQRKRQERKRAHKPVSPPDPERFKVWGIRSNGRTHEDNKPT